MDKRIVSIILAIVLALIPCLPALAESSSTVTIAMVTAKEVAIKLEPNSWDITKEVEPNKEYKTRPTCFNITNEGSCAVNIYIKGEDAVWVDNPSAYKWELSGTGSNGKDIYALWYHIAYDDKDSYTPITKTDTKMKKGNGTVIEIDPNKNKKFGLKLLTPTFFCGGRKMQTTITISAVAA